MPSLPLDVLAEARSLAWRCGIDEPSAISLTAEAWSDHPDPLWRTVAHRRCVDERRRLSGRTGDDRQPVPILDDPDMPDLTGCDDPDLCAVEDRCDLVAVIGRLPDDELAALARTFWLRMPWTVDTYRAVRHARKPPPAPCLLSKRECEVAAAAADGLTKDQIGARLHLSPNTVKSHLQRIARKLGADNTTHAVAIALRAGWIT